MIQIIAIDPGSKWTGVVVQDRAGHLMAHGTLRRTRNDEPLDQYLIEAERQLLALLSPLELDVDTTLVAVEQCVAPRPVKGKLTNPRAIIETAEVAGWLKRVLVHRYGGGLVTVAPNNHGNRNEHLDLAVAVHAGIYPAQLVGDTETTGSGHGMRHHQRAAWDIAEAARTEWTLNNRSTR